MSDYMFMLESHLSPEQNRAVAAIESAVFASAISRKLSVALDPKMSSASFACRIDAISWRRITASKASAALRSPPSPPPAAAGVGVGARVEEMGVVI